MNKKRWFDKAISFACTSCGKCCKSYKNQIKVYVNIAEALQISDHIDMDIKDFQQKYIEIHYDQDSNELISLKSNDTKSNCIFLKENQCSIYQVRPTQCRTYPYWPQIMLDKASWLEEAKACEGIIHLVDDSIGLTTSPPNKINNIKSHTHNITSTVVGNIKITPTKDRKLFNAIVSKEEILLNMIIHSIHDRGLGPENWTYDEAYALLHESIQKSPELMDEFEADFFESNKTNIVYETPFLRVVDSNRDQSIDTTTQQHLYKYSRRMEFVDMPQLTQSEMFINKLSSNTYASTDNDDHDDGHDVDHVDDVDKVFVVHSELVMQVHQVMSTVIIKYLDEIQNPITTLESYSKIKTSDIAIIGAGCCALPQYLLCEQNQMKYTFLQGLSIDAIEPEEQVLDVAEKYFDIHFDSNRLVKYNMNGSTFLNQMTQKNNLASKIYDIIVIDAFAVDDSHSYAPPKDLLVEWHNLAQLLRSKASTSTSITTDTIGGGLLVMNVYGSPSWISEVQLQIEQSNMFCTPIQLAVDYDHTNINATIPIETTTTIQSENTVKNKNVVFITMLKEDSHWFNSNMK